MAMNAHKELAIRALENMRSDDLHRARHAFRNFTPEQMKEPHGTSGRTRAEILAEYEEFDQQINEAIAWVRAQA